VRGVPGERAPEGKLGVDAWLPIYERAVRLVDEHHSAWLHVQSLLAQRGELYGLSAAGTQTYMRVSALAQKHVAALGALAAAHPARFQSLGIVGLVFQPGVLADPPLFEAITKLSQRGVALKIESAPDVSRGVRRRPVVPAHDAGRALHGAEARAGAEARRFLR
jgi:hypothetical protein